MEPKTDNTSHGKPGGGRFAKAETKTEEPDRGVHHLRSAAVSGLRRGGIRGSDSGHCRCGQNERTGENGPALLQRDLGSPAPEGYDGWETGKRDAENDYRKWDYHYLALPGG